MAVLIRMPEVAANATAAVLSAWLRKSGEEVVEGECIAEIETDKAVVELSAPRTGQLAQLQVGEGCEIPVGAPLAVLLEPGEGIDVANALLADCEQLGGSEQSKVRDSQPSSPEKAVRPDVEPSLPQRAAHIPATPEAVGFGGRRPASPVARRQAAAAGLDLELLNGTGPRGRIVLRDVERMRESAAHAHVTDPAKHQTVTPLTPMRHAIASRLTQSKSTVPHFYLAAQCRTERLSELRAQIHVQTGLKPSINDFVVRAAALALRNVPQANVQWSADGVRQLGAVDVAIAVDVDSGLYTPVIRGADTQTLAGIGKACADLAERARANRLSPTEYQGGSMTVSNLGMYGVTTFTAILNPPQALILAVGAIQSVPVVENGSVIAGSVMEVTLSADHRVIDGVVAARWMQAFQELIEAPLALLI